MPASNTMALPLMGTLIVAGVLFSCHTARAQALAPPLIAEEIRHAQSDFVAERCVVYGYSALLLGNAGGVTAGTSWMRHLTPDIVAPGQLEMTAIMGIPEGPQQSWLDRYQHWVAESFAADARDLEVRDADATNVDAPDGGASRDRPPRWGDPRSGVSYDGTPYGAAPRDGDGAGGRTFGAPNNGAPYDGGQYGGNQYGGGRTIGAQDDRAPRADAQYGGGRIGGFPIEGRPYGQYAGQYGSGGRVSFGGTYGDAPRPAIADGAAHAAFGGGRGNPDRQTDLARMADGKYPRDALQQPDIADAVRQLAGPILFGHLKDYSFASPIEFTGRYTVGTACEPHACGVSEARFVFSPDTVWIGIIRNGRMRIYGNPPRLVRTLLLRDRDQTVWRGAVEDVTRAAQAAVPPQVIQVSADPAAGPSHLSGTPRGFPVATEPVPGGPPRLSITPRPFLVATDPTQTLVPDGTTEVRLLNLDGTFEVPVTINGAVTLPFAIDSGSSDVSASTDVMDRLIQAGTLSRADFLGKQVYHLADGSAVSNETFRIHVLKVGDREVRDVMGSITNDADSLLLGQSFLKRFRSWSIDNQRQVLVLK